MKTKEIKPTNQQQQKNGKQNKRERGKKLQPFLFDGEEYPFFLSNTIPNSRLEIKPNSFQHLTSSSPNMKFLTSHNPYSGTGASSSHSNTGLAQFYETWSLSVKQTAKIARSKNKVRRHHLYVITCHSLSWGSVQSDLTSLASTYLCLVNLNCLTSSVHGWLHIPAINLLVMPILHVVFLLMVFQRSRGIREEQMTHFIHRKVTSETK